MSDTTLSPHSSVEAETKPKQSATGPSAVTTASLILIGLSMVFLASALVFLRSAMRIHEYRDDVAGGTFTANDAVPYVGFGLVDYATIAGAGFLAFSGVAVAIVVTVNFVKVKKRT